MNTTYSDCLRCGKFGGSVVTICSYCLEEDKAVRVALLAACKKALDCGIFGDDYNETCDMLEAALADALESPQRDQSIRGDKTESADDIAGRSRAPAGRPRSRHVAPRGGQCRSRSAPAFVSERGGVCGEVEGRSRRGAGTSVRYVQHSTCRPRA